MCNNEEDSINNHKQNKCVKDKQQNPIGVFPLHIFKTYNFI